MSEARLRELERQVSDLQSLSARGIELASRHGDEHWDLGRDPIIAGAVTAHSHQYDRILREGDSVTAAVTAGAKTILLLNGTYTLDANVTIPADGLLAGITKAGVIVQPGAFRIVANGLLTTMTVQGGTHATSSVTGVGVIDDLLFDGGLRPVNLSLFTSLRNSRFINYAGVPANGDYYVQSPSVVAVGWSITDCIFENGPAISLHGYFGARISRCIAFQQNSPTVPLIHIGSGGGFGSGIQLSDLTLITQASGSASSDAGYITVGDDSVASGVDINGIQLLRQGSTSVPFVVKTASTGTTISRITDLPASNSGVISCVILNAHRCSVSNCSVRADGAGGDGVLSDSVDRSRIIGNRLGNFDRGIYIKNTASEKCILVGNDVQGNTQTLVDEGIGTQKIGNITT